ncbi:SDR family NAD(P)-dependent oxidoreductase [Candidatus Poriferisocius sp.]|uniref:SDR family NAD(P)-dependent oxidoreductase n=1 Tax=Candidatus Poriferisocius sp. TaxID=3101276 RepID=UPI003B01D163
MFDLSGRVALVTGAGQGVGAGIAARLAERGAAVAVNDRHAERAESTVAAVRAAGGTALAVPFDVADREAVTEAVAATTSGLGPVDVLVNNAGIPESMMPTQFVDMDPEQWSPYLDVNLHGVLNCCHVVVPKMCERGFGRVITISSGAGVVGLNIGVSLYAAGKGGALGFMRHLALETARRGVTANSLALGLMGMREPTEVTDSMARQVPVGRLGRPDDVGYICVYLASDEASWMTGQTIHINGGAVTT